MNPMQPTSSSNDTLTQWVCLAFLMGILCGLLARRSNRTRDVNHRRITTLFSVIVNSTLTIHP